MLQRRLVNGVAIVALLAGNALGAATQRDTRARHPNVILILMDNMGYGDIGSYGGRDARTPHLDRLAREGVRLTDAYANGAVCTPTRAALITGQYQQRVGLEWALGAPEDDDRGLPVMGTSLPALLRSNGYATGLIGKWHLGVKPEFGPNAHGFDEFFGFLSGAVDFYMHRRGDGAPDLYQNTSPVEAPGYLTDEISQRGVDFIERHASRPFFLEVAHNAVHWPFQPPDMPASSRQGVPQPNEQGDFRLYQGPEDRLPATRRDYVRMLERVDQGVGQMLATLERHGLTRNTLVIFTNDNGGDWLSRSAPLSHRAGTLWEGGIRVPLILRWPDRLPANKVSPQVAITMDLTASVLAASRTPVPPGLRLDGIDLLGVLAGESSTVSRPVFWRIAQTHRKQKAVRWDEWKLLDDAGEVLLFDVRNDPGERNDVAAQHPEVVRKLTMMLADWEKDVDRR